MIYNFQRTIMDKSTLCMAVYVQRVFAIHFHVNSYENGNRQKNVNHTNKFKWLIYQTSISVRKNVTFVNNKYDLKQNIVHRKFYNDFPRYKNLLIFDYLRSQDK